jgi:hypothetical protein
VQRSVTVRHAAHQNPAKQFEPEASRKRPKTGRRGGRTIPAEPNKPIQASLNPKWPAIVIAFALAVTVAWTALLAWLVLHIGLLLV